MCSKTAFSSDLQGTIFNFSYSCYSSSSLYNVQHISSRPAQLPGHPGPLKRGLIITEPFIAKYFSAVKSSFFQYTLGLSHNESPTIDSVSNYLLCPLLKLSCYLISYPFLSLAHSFFSSPSLLH